MTREFITGLLTGIIVGLIAAFFINPPNTIHQDQPTTPPLNITAIDVEAWYCEPDGQFITAQGQIKNVSNQALENVLVAVEVYNNNTFVAGDQSFVILRALLPGDTTTFEVMIDKPSAYTSCTIKFYNQGKYPLKHFEKKAAASNGRQRPIMGEPYFFE